MRKNTKSQGNKPKSGKTPRLTSFPGVPGVYVRHLATSQRLVFRMRIDGADKYASLSVSPSAPLAEIRAAADEMRDRLLHPVKSIADFIDDYATAKALRPSSITALKQALRGFTADNDAANEKAVVAIQTNADYSDGTKRAYLQRISAFFRWMNEMGARIKNPTTGRRIPKAPGAKDYGFTAADIDALLADVDRDGTLEDRLYVRLLRYTGARCSTVYAIAPQDFTADGEGYHVRLQNVKCGRQYETPLPVTDAETCALIRTRLAKVKKHFWADSERALHDRLVRRMKRVIGPQASPHGLRHYVACELLEKGVPVEVVSRILDHSSIAITHAVYAKQSQSAIDEALGRITKY